VQSLWRDGRRDGPSTSETFNRGAGRRVGDIGDQRGAGAGRPCRCLDRRADSARRHTAAARHDRHPSERQQPRRHHAIGPGGSAARQRQRGPRHHFLPGHGSGQSGGRADLLGRNPRQSVRRREPGSGKRLVHAHCPARWRRRTAGQNGPVSGGRWKNGKSADIDATASARTPAPSGTARTRRASSSTTAAGARVTPPCSAHTSACASRIRTARTCHTSPADFRCAGRDSARRLCRATARTGFTRRGTKHIASRSPESTAPAGCCERRSAATARTSQPARTGGKTSTGSARGGASCSTSRESRGDLECGADVSRFHRPDRSDAQLHAAGRSRRRNAARQRSRISSIRHTTDRRGIVLLDRHSRDAIRDRYLPRNGWRRPPRNGGAW
jgi:hypothetical protein